MTTTTTIRISIELKKELSSIGSKDDTYESIIKRLMRPKANEKLINIPEKIDNLSDKQKKDFKDSFDSWIQLWLRSRNINLEEL